MKNKLIIGGLAAVLAAVSSPVFANGTPAPEPQQEGVEISGNVTTVVGYQHDDKDALAGNNGAAGAYGGMGDFLGNIANGDHFRFIVDQVEVDLQKTFGENIRLRADIDFYDLANTGHRAADTVDLEQAYVTANLAAGNGIEFLIGKFNAPVGDDSVDRHNNWLISYSSSFRFLTPTNVTGAKLYYAFSDLIDLHVAVVNDLNANGFATDSALPSGLFRLGFNWGEEGNESTIGLSGGAGPEQIAAGPSHNAHWDFYGDMDLMIAVSDAITVASEWTYRQTNTASGGGANQKAFAGFFALNYEISDVWDVTFRGDGIWDINPQSNAAARGTSGASTTAAAWSNFEGMLITGSVGAGYDIADGAKMKLEYRFDWKRTAGPTFDADFHAVLAEFAYNF